MSRTLAVDLEPDEVGAERRSWGANQRRFGHITDAERAEVLTADGGAGAPSSGHSAIESRLYATSAALARALATRPVRH
ncbi:MAG: hypothetical protein ACRDTA_07780 [Pseudonocardiaceae bacterium]